ncbi:ATP-binding cassette domain-containing protein [Marinomonas ostreistagni]|uniref:ATP-binding cassette domain-containing protein n=2 Tax=Marinomonas ostreistagni TaxID=359209 RepID=A0ABS0ZG48_9GAMM|nr:ATP-binding cassette domain-containing protein [Marinomonas ostreistagni]
MGASGVGKSSLLAYLSGTLPSGLTGHGEVTLDHLTIQDLPIEKRQLGLLQQSPLLFNHLTVEENLLFAYKSPESRFLRKKDIRSKLVEIGLEGLEHQLPQHLSGGQQARLALLRTLLAKPKALLLDEPFSKLDHSLRIEMRELVLDAIQKTQVPTILVTHDQEDADVMATRVYNLRPI